MSRRDGPAWVRVRAAGAQDFDAVAALYRQGDRYHVELASPGLRPMPQAYPRAEYDAALANAAMRLLVAEAEGRIVGFVRVERVDYPGSRLTRPRIYVIVHEIVVDEGGRASGIGTALMAAVEPFAREVGADAIELTVHAVNPRALAFYERLGFAPMSIRLHRKVEHKS